jgi:spore coat polysaccharide biosynthesis predicted glycosyltransferase SpsG
LAEALSSREFTNAFCGSFDETARQLIIEADVEVVSPATDLTSALPFHAAPAVVVIDLPEPQPARLAELARKYEGASILVVDDFYRGAPYPESVTVLNFRVDAASSAPSQNGVRFLCGPQYLLLRRAFVELVSTPRVQKRSVKRVAIAVGGSDIHAVQGRVAEALAAACPDLEVDSLVGLPAGEFAGRLAAADACVTGGGLLKYEALYLGFIPGVVSQTADEHTDTAVLAHRGLCSDLGLARRHDADRVIAGVVGWARSPVPKRRAPDRTPLIPRDPAGAVADALIGSPR